MGVVNITYSAICLCGDGSDRSAIPPSLECRHPSEPLEYAGVSVASDDVPTTGSIAIAADGQLGAVAPFV